MPWAVSVTPVIEGMGEVDKAEGCAHGEETLGVWGLRVMVTKAGGIEISSNNEVPHGAVLLDSLFKLVPYSIAVRCVVR
jgi:hypothetical protein